MSICRLLQSLWLGVQDICLEIFKTRSFLQMGQSKPLSLRVFLNGLDTDGSPRRCSQRGQMQPLMDVSPQLPFPLQGLLHLELPCFLCGFNSVSAIWKTELPLPLSPKDLINGPKTWTMETVKCQELPVLCQASALHRGFQHLS